MKFTGLRIRLPRKHCGADSGPSRGSSVALVRSSTWRVRCGRCCGGSRRAGEQGYRGCRCGGKEEATQLAQGGQMHLGRSSSQEVTHFLRMASWCLLHRLKRGSLNWSKMRVSTATMTVWAPPWGPAPSVKPPRCGICRCTYFHQSSCVSYISLSSYSLPDLESVVRKEKRKGHVCAWVH